MHGDVAEWLRVLHGDVAEWHSVLRGDVAGWRITVGFRSLYCCNEGVSLRALHGCSDSFRLVGCTDLCSSLSGRSYRFFTSSVCLAGSFSHF